LILKNQELLDIAGDGDLRSSFYEYRYVDQLLAVLGWTVHGMDSVELNQHLLDFYAYCSHFKIALGNAEGSVLGDINNWSAGQEKRLKG